MQGNKYVSYLQKQWPQLNQPQEMAFITPGKVRLGNYNDPEYPVHEKEMAGFYIDRHEVTRGEFARFAKQAYTNDQYWSAEGQKWRQDQKRKSPAFNWEYPSNATEAMQPVTCITYYEAEAFAKWQGKRLPTPEEWERAARYIDMRPFPWGDANPRTGNYFRTNFRQVNAAKDGKPGLALVGSFLDDQTPEGVFDMAGNVAEWCAGWYKDDPKKKLRSTKGGSYRQLWFQLPAYIENGCKPYRGYEDVGFRCVKDIPEFSIDK